MLTLNARASGPDFLHLPTFSAANAQSRFYNIGQQLEERQEDYNDEDYELPDPDVYGDLDEIIQQKLNPTNAPAISTNGRLLIPFCYYAQRSLKGSV